MTSKPETHSWQSQKLLHCIQCGVKYLIIQEKYLSPMPIAGLEPTTFWLRNKCSTNWAKSANNRWNSPIFLSHYFLVVHYRFFITRLMVEYHRFFIAHLMVEHHRFTSWLIYIPHHQFRCSFYLGIPVQRPSTNSSLYWALHIPSQLYYCSCRG